MLFTVREEREGFTRLDDKLDGFPEKLDRIPTKVSDEFLIYFTSGTTGNPKSCSPHLLLSARTYRRCGILALCPE